MAIEGTLANISAALERALSAEHIARQKGWLQNLDPRVKLLSCLALLITINLSHNLSIILAFYAFSLLLAWGSAVPLWPFIRRAWLIVAFFTGLAALPALFITPGMPWLTLPFGLIITQSGITTTLFLILRVSTSVSLATLMILTTPWNSLLNALAGLRVPDVIVLILGMTLRYIFLFLQKANDMFLSRKSRIVGRLDDARQRKLLAETSGTLLNHSLYLSGEVYLAMRSRGFSGYPRVFAPKPLGLRDGLWGGAAFLAAAIAIWLGR